MQMYFNIRGQLITPSSNEGLTQRQRILKYLLDARLENRPKIYIDNGPGNQVVRSGGYVPMYELDHICSARDVRLRELRREHGIPICDPHVFQDATYYTSDGQRKKYDVPQYRIELNPDRIRELDWSRFWEKPMTAVFNEQAMDLVDRRPPEFKTEANGQRAFI